MLMIFKGVLDLPALILSSDHTLLYKDRDLRVSFKHQYALIE